MTLEKCYQNCGGNYEDILLRFRSAERIERFVMKFLDDQSYTNLLSSLEKNDIEDAFRFAHTLKGVAQNLGFNHLAESSSALTELLRNNQLDDFSVAVIQVREDYQCVINAIKEFQSEC